MNFDLSSFLQRQSNIPMSDQGMRALHAGSAFQTGSPYGQSSEALSLSVGQIISGQVVSVSEDGVLVEVAPGTLLQAKVEDGVSLLKGMSVSFEVSGVSDKQVALRTLFQNTANTETMHKALDAAQLPLTKETTTMVNAMMKEGMPIDRSALQDMYRQVMAHPEISAEHIVTMNRLDIPVTDANVKQFSDYMHMQHQLVGSVETIADSLIENVTELFSNSQTKEAASLMNEFVKLFTNDEMPNSEVQEQSNALQNTQNTNAETMINQSAPEKQIITELPLREIAKENSDASRKEWDTLIHDRGVQKEMQQLGISEEKAEQYLKGELPAKDMLRLTGELLAKIAEQGNDAKLSHFVKLLNRPELQNAVREQMFKQWLMEPSEVSDKQRVTEFYEKLSAQTGKLVKALNDITGVSQNLTNQVSNMNQNIDFMNQLNQTMNYVQLPLKLAGDNAHGDLYVYTNKRNLTENDGNVSAFLHLDMEHLGPVDVYVAMQQQKVSTQFYLQDEDMLSFIHDNIGLLNERLTQKGYSMRAEFSVKEKPGNVMEEMVKDHEENVKIGTFSFDMRA